MSITMGWLAVALAALAGAPPAKPAGPDIVYQYRIVEMHGLQWREQAGAGLKPVTSHGAVSVWTAPASFLKSLPAGIAKETFATLRVAAPSMIPAHITTRKSREFVTQAAWIDEAKDLRIKYESVRSGMAATVAGRKLDQGILVQLVIEDTDIRSIHTLNVSSPADASSTRHPIEPANCSAGQASCDAKPCAGCLQSALTAVADANVSSVPRCPLLSKAGRATAAPGACDSACPGSGHAKTTDREAKQAALKSASGAACCADDADNASECHGTDAEKTKAAAQVQIPEIGREAVAGEWLIPHGEVLVVSFGPHTIADKDGKAIVREKLALVTAQEADPVPTPSSAATPHELLPPPTMLRNLPKLAAPAPMAVPRIPSRSIPQGVHADGTPAELPPLPDDEKLGQPTSESSQPMPSPQIKKPRPHAQPAPNTARPAASVDQKTSKASFMQAQPWLKAAGLLSFPRSNMAASFLPIPNLQFMVPLKPLSLKLPLGQKLELELVGRVVPDPDAASADED
jgi:hypothetical protein